MNCAHRTAVVKGALLALLAVTVTAGPSLSAELAAVPGEWLPPGGTVGVDEIPMWGYVDAGADASAYTCPPEPVDWDVGPVITVPVGSLTINLKNCLAEDVSIYIPGQPRILTPQYKPGGDAEGRERLTSFDVTVETDATGIYTWTAREGTYLYYSGTNVRTQVPMGLYGALVVTGGTEPEYPAYDQDEVLVFSEIDPMLNANPATFTGARVSNWLPQHFLINGEAYPNTADIDINVSEDVLLRFVNAGLQPYAPTLEGGLYMDVIGEDGNLYYPYSLTQYGLDLPPGKTMDAVVNVGSSGSYAVYDRSGHQANGGMIAFLQAGTVPGAPVAVDDPYSIDEDTILVADGLAPNPAGVLANDTGGAVEARLVSDVSSGTLTLDTDGTFSYSPNANFAGSDSFTYVANDGAGGPDSNTATASITVTGSNDAPVANPDGYGVTAGTMLNVAAPGVLDNDTDADGDSLTAMVVGTPGGVTLNSDGGFSFDATGLAAGAIGTFAYVANDSAVASASATVTITVTPAPDNTAPVANEDTAETPRNTSLVNYDIVANDTDVDNNIDPTSVVITTGSTTQRGGTVVNNGDGTITFTPRNAGFRGTDTFQYTVNDDDGAMSNTAIVRINVLR